jgi:hypothetical protein
VLILETTFHLILRGTFSLVRILAATALTIPEWGEYEERAFYEMNKL